MQKWREWALLTTYAIILALALLNVGKIAEQLSFVLQIIRPITYGFVMAYLLNFIMSAIERYLRIVINSKSPRVLRLHRPLAILISLSLTCIVIYTIIAVMIPELASSFSLLRQRAPELSATLSGYIRDFLQTYQLNDLFWVELQRNLSLFTNQMIQLLSDTIPVLLSVSVVITNAVFNISIGLIIAVYLLSGKERLSAQLKRALTIIVGSEKVTRLSGIGSMMTRSFNNYVRVRLMESLVIFAVMSASMLLLSMPYVTLVSMVIALANLIPIIGPIVGAIPCFFIIAVMDPSKAIVFLLLHVVVQQLEGNIVGPQLSRNMLGLPALWVLVSIVLGGGFFGIIGLLIAPPLTTVVYDLLRQYLIHKEQRSMLEDSYEA